MAWKKHSTKEDISGFWNRKEGSVIEGVLLKRVLFNEDNAFYIVRLSKESENIDDEGHGTITVPAGKLVAISGNMAVANVCDELLATGKSYGVRFTSNGKKSGKGGKTFWDIQTDSCPADEMDAPFGK